MAVTHTTAARNAATDAVTALINGLWSFGLRYGYSQCNHK